jgi:hypothetical protein
MLFLDGVYVDGPDIDQGAELQVVPVPLDVIVVCD